MKSFFTKIVALFLFFAAALLYAEMPRYLRIGEGEKAERQLVEKFSVPAGSFVAIEAVAPDANVPVPLLDETKKAYLAMSREERIKNFADPEFRKKLKEAGFYPLPVTLWWRRTESVNGPVRVAVSESPDFEEAAVFTASGDSLKLDNFKIGTRYYWQVIIPGEETPTISTVSSFETESVAPRLLRIDGISNARDLGGRKGRNGQRVRQGLAYRNAGLNQNAARTRDSKKLRAIRDEALKTDPEFDRVYRSYQARIEELNKEKDSPAQVFPLRGLLSAKWQVFFPEKNASTQEIRELSCMSAMPEKILDTAPRSCTADASGRMKFESKMDHCAFFLQEFDAPRDGVLQFGAGSDWYMLITVNGKLVCDTLAGGNIKSDINSENYMIDAPVKAGKNLLFVAVRSGMSSWQLCCREPETPYPRQEVLADMVKNLNRAAVDMIPNQKEPGKILLNDEMKQYVVEDLGWKSDIDLRTDGECFGMTGSPAGDQVHWFHYSSSAYAGMQSKKGKKAFGRVFRVFLDRKNYPVDFHCIAGQDRTGAVAFILNALLGVEEEELYRDWEATGFWNGQLKFSHRNLFNKLIRGFDAYPGKTVNERVENYVLSCGFTPEDVARFRDIMLEK